MFPLVYLPEIALIPSAGHAAKFGSDSTQLCCFRAQSRKENMEENIHDFCRWVSVKFFFYILILARREYFIFFL